MLDGQSMVMKPPQIDDPYDPSKRGSMMKDSAKSDIFPNGIDSDYDQNR